MGNSSIGGRSEAHFSSGGNVITHVDFFRPQKGKVRDRQLQQGPAVWLSCRVAGYA